MRRALGVVVIAAALALLVAAKGESSPTPGGGSSHQECGSWGSYGRVPARTFDYDCPSAISPSTVGALRPLWVFKTDKTVTASPAVVDGRVFVGDWSATMYALDADTGEELWRFAAHDAPGAEFGPIVASAAVASTSEGRSLVVFGAGPTLHALDAESGDEVWSTYVGSAASRAEHPDDEQTEFESSPVVVDGIVYSGIDVHNQRVDENHGVRGGVLAFDLATGSVLGRFDPEHDFRDAVTGDQLSGCSSVWSSPTIDVSTDTLYFATGNCPHDLPEGSVWGRHIEAVSAIDADPSTWARPASAVKWTYTPEPMNRDDTDFGATPNLFLDVTGRKVLGIGKKNAVYYALDPQSGAVLWSRKTTEPGNFGEDFAVGGFIGSTATGRGGVFGGTALGPSPPYFHALEGTDGSVRWNGTTAPSYAASAFVNDVVMAGALDNLLKAWDARTGDLLFTSPLAGPISSGPAVVGDRVFIGSGTSSSDLCAKDAPASEVCFAAFDEALGRTGAVHAFALAAPGHRAADGGTETGGVLLAHEGNRAWAHDLDTLERRVVVRNASEGAPADADVADVNGQICFDPVNPGHYIAGEDTGQPDPPPGWGYFAVSGSATIEELSVTQVGKLTPSYLGAPDNYGCGFLPDGRLVTTAIGDPYPGQPGNGELLLWFPPFDRTDVRYCKLDSTLATAGGVYVDGTDIYVATHRPDDDGNLAGVFRYRGDLPSSVDECTGRDATGAPVVDDGVLTKEPFISGHPSVPTPSAITGSGHGTFYVSSVYSGTIAEFAADGAFVRVVLAPSGPPGTTTGTPFGLAVDRDGTLYYADLGIVGVEPGEANGTVRRIRFDEGGEPLAPETLNAGLDYPDGIGLLPPASGVPRVTERPGEDAGRPVGAGRPAPRPVLPATGGTEAGAGLGAVLLASAVLARRLRSRSMP